MGDGKESEGSRAIIASADRHDERPLWISVWGGANCLAQALWEVQRTRSTTEVKAFVSKLRVYSISDQDDAGRWIRQTFPDLFYIVSPSTVNGDEYYTATWTGISGDRHYKNAPFENFELVDNPWLTEHVRENHGPLGLLYPKVAYIMEGDTPAFLNLIPTGLASDVSPDWGGWGGRYALRQSYGETRPIWTNSRDTVQLKNGQEHTSNQATIWRWREAYQNDFAARMDWCVKPRDQANHPPSLTVNGKPGKEVLRLSARAGETVSLSAAGSRDPEGNTLSYHWFHYPEAGSPKKTRSPLLIENSDKAQATLRIPPVGKPESVHLILEVSDDGNPRLFSYRRVIVEISP